jgi:hypothetical protein
MSTGNKLLDFVKSERQWKREHRIGYATYMMNKASKDEKPFWILVLEEYEAFK